MKIKLITMREKCGKKLNPMDMALRGEGFFALNNTNGDSVYTRDGQFYVNAEGVMVNSMGHEFSDVEDLQFKRFRVEVTSALIKKD